jgi:hypothetical protein
MSNVFQLTEDENGNWTGTVPQKVTIRVVPADTTLQIKLADALYPAVTAIPCEGDTATFDLVSGAAGLTVSITPRVIPAIIWSLVEVGSDGKSTQTLARVNQPDPSNPRFSTAVTITGQKG